MGVLIPLEVPWKISQNEHSLALGTRCVDGINHALVTFLGVLISQGHSPSRQGQHCEIAVTLKDVVYIKLFSESVGEDDERISSYDWSHCPDLRHGESLNAYTQRFIDQWNASGRCPNPFAYVVQNSELIDRLGLGGHALEHYLFVGYDYNVEAVAEAWTWEVLAQDARSATATGPAASTDN